MTIVTVKMRTLQLVLLSTLIWTSTSNKVFSQDSLLISLVQSSEQAAEMAQLNPAQIATLERNLTVMRQAIATGEVLSEQKDIFSVAHARQNTLRDAKILAPLSPSLEAALNEVKTLVNSTGGIFQTLLSQGNDTTMVIQLLNPWQTFQLGELTDAMDRNLAILDQYEKKFGPGSVRLNPVETLLNYAFQSVPGFGPSSNGSPGPGEWIAAYNTSYLHYTDGSSMLQFVSAVELGYRHYFLNPGWGEGSPLRPTYASVGVLFAGSNDGALILPWQGDDGRIGAFASWGDYKFAYLTGDESRFLFTRQFQIFDHLF